MKDYSGGSAPVPTNAGERRKPAFGLYGELTVEQARSLAQEWLAQVRRGGYPEPSEADKSLTKWLLEALSLVDVRMLDHIIAGGTKSTSFVEHGLI